MESRLNRYKADAEKAKDKAVAEAKENVVAEAKKDKDEEISRLHEELETEKAAMKEDRRNAIAKVEKDLYEKYVLIEQNFSKELDDSMARKEYYKGIVKDNMLSFIELEDESTVGIPYVEDVEEEARESVLTISEGVNVDDVLNDLNDVTVGDGERSPDPPVE